MSRSPSLRGIVVQTARELADELRNLVVNLDGGWPLRRRGHQAAVHNIVQERQDLVVRVDLLQMRDGVHIVKPAAR